MGDDAVLAHDEAVWRLLFYPVFPVVLSLNDESGLGWGRSDSRSGGLRVLNSMNAPVGLHADGFIDFIVFLRLTENSFLVMPIGGRSVNL